MKNVYLRIAGFTIRLVFHKTKTPAVRNNLKEEVIQCIKSFTLKKPQTKVDFTLEFKGGQGSMIFKNNKSVFLYLYEEKNKNTIVVNYYIQKSQFLLLIRHILDTLLGKNGFIIHCSASLVGKNAIVFIGKSGAGKSTIAKLISPEQKRLADDLGIVKREKGKLFFYQTPFVEKNTDFQKGSRGYPLGSICILHKSLQCKAVRPKNKLEFLKKIAIQIRTELHEYTNIKMRFLFHAFSDFEGNYELFFPKNSKHTLVRCLQEISA
jgi:hypothetical protein